MLAALAFVLALAPSIARAQFTYRPAGELVSGSGRGRVDSRVYAPGIRFPVRDAPAYLNSQVWGVGGNEGPSGSQCDARNFSYPWRDNYCESRSWDMPLCPAGQGHQGQDIRGSSCMNNVHPVVAVVDGTITNIGSYSVYLTAADGTRFDYLHMGSVRVSVGQRVTRGTVVGNVSNAFGGTPTTVHLHFNIRQNVSGVGSVYVPTYMSLVRSYEALIGPSTPRFRAEYVSQSFPLARDPFQLAPGEERAGHIELRNTGTETWRPGQTFLGTTEPRDRASPLAGPDWVAPNRAATVDRDVAPGATGRFAFTVRAPASAGDYPQFFNLVQESVAWFSDSGGPVDGQLQVRVTVVPPADADGDGSTRDVDCDDANAGVHPGAEETCGDAIDQDCDGSDLACAPDPDGGSLPIADGGSIPTGDAGTTIPGDRDAGTSPPTASPRISGGCGCVVGGRAPSHAGALVIAALASMMLVRRRRR
ncbi:hypothetical protein DB32_003128 [Sandaracinus amylolyticus]|uniref:M23ase beta-sheet core domain-containing protein n=2 Tax=Sandaracinus amylolyticus TaxID=927083 RepID=A0A0F6SEY0_9BACT|nr:hypothetical protein DB32_003128 [Sandaracinus amylolyticus]